MLILRRFVGETICIADNIVLRVLSVNKDGTQVRLGIEAPESIPVHRKEVYDKIKEQHDGKEGKANA